MTKEFTSVIKKLIVNSRKLAKECELEGYLPVQVSTLSDIAEKMLKEETGNKKDKDSMWEQTKIEYDTSIY